MRKTAFFLLLATIAAPAFARDPDSDREARREKAQAERAERAEAREERREERTQRVEQAEPRKERTVELNDGSRAVTREERREATEQRQVDRRAERADNIEQRRDAVEAARDVRRDERIERRVERRPPPVVSNVPREGTQPPPVATSGHSSGSHHWDGKWRNDHRYDWHKHRHHHRSLFRLGFYYDPFGWGYRPYSIGWRLWPSYYRSAYWLNDPWMYRLPPAYVGTRWIRYYNDALLVDTWTGEVVDVIYDFFW